MTLFHEEKGKHFDPLVVEAFIQNIDKILRVKNRLLE